jgi:hypothetical protein
VKAKLLRAGTTGKLAVRHMLTLIELMKNIERLVNYSVKGQNTLYSFSQSVAVVEEEDSEGEGLDEEESVDEAEIEEPAVVESEIESDKNGSGRPI